MQHHSKTLDDAIRQACARHAGATPDPALLATARAAVADVLADRESAPGLGAEVEALADFIARARREIRAIGADRIAGACIPTASDELTAIGAHLEEATGTILDACERIQDELDAATPAQAGHGRSLIEAEVTRIFEACNFQDLTGQRITKVIRTLQEIEERTEGLLTIVRGGRQRARRVSSRAGDPTRSADEALLNGPARPGEGVSQSDVDALLNEV